MNLSDELFNAIVNYLANQPYAQVTNLVTAIAKEVEAQKPKEMKPVSPVSLVSQSEEKAPEVKNAQPAKKQKAPKA